MEELMKKTVLFLLFSLLALGAAQPTGKWSGSFDITNSEGETKADTAYFDLTEHEGTVTGTAGPNAEKQWPLRKGRLNGQTLQFEVLMDDGGVLMFDLIFDGESIQGTCAGTGSGGEKLSAKVHLKRAT
jgi:hypothetical protein